MEFKGSTKIMNPGIGKQVIRRPGLLKNLLLHLRPRPKSRARSENGTGTAKCSGCAPDLWQYNQSFRLLTPLAMEAQVVNTGWDGTEIPLGPTGIIQAISGQLTPRCIK